MILITGASSGLGAALAKHYHADDIDLLLTGRNSQRLARVKNTNAPCAQTVVADLSEPEQIQAVFKQATNPIQTVIHCAGSGLFGELGEQSPSEIKKLVQDNLTATIFFIQAVVERYQDQALDLVVVMSTAAQTAKSGESTYCAVKWGIKGFVESVRLELKNKPMNIIAVYPGGMATSFWQSSGKQIDTRQFMTADEAAIMLKQALTSSAHGYISDITINRKP
ncbi:SDR family NAD(P)-dependent oxidoreductase [Shewanella gelidii]|uniref:Short-chain dehydrogenase n=1 Tax=Shewanella gelidii TaxID=1642821 RepID=A0A917K0V9_9GAMM|nr:SDR family NAD(P)-dependent oxidoreductase [Shewanella gelidii]MCL1099598.1 SDR family NAD(P)-dependent oxidoreductase [Shewanella gelidii]GGI92637.1 short-chain dehydrogenase [Shewanella gelidii]